MALPTLSATEEQSARIITAFGTEADYLDWLARMIREEVYQREVMPKINDIEQVMVTQRQSIMDALGTLGA